MAQAIKKIKVGDETHPIDGAFYLGTLSTVAGSASSGSYKSVRWYVSDCEGVTAPYDGMRIAIKIPLAGVGTAGVILSINGNTDADYHPLAYNVNTVLTTHFPVNSIKVFVYDASQKMTCYKTANTAVSVTGVWKADSNYDSNTVVTYGTLEYYFRPYVATEALYRYKFVMLDKDNRLVPLTTTNVANGTAVTNQTPTAKAFRPDKIWWYATTTTISAGAVVGGQILYRSGYNANNTTNGGMAICNFNSTISAYRLIYLCGTFDKATGLFSLRGGGTASSTQYYTQVPTNTANITLSSYFTSGYDYILLGGTYSSNNYIQLFDNNTMFHFDGTNLVPYDTWNIAQASSNQKVQGNGTGFGADATVNIVGGNNITVTGDATNNKITISGTGDTHYTSTFTVYGGSTSVATFNQSTNMTLSFAAGNNITLTPDATNHKITISATAPAATGWAGTLSLEANPYSNGTQSVNALYANNVYVSEAIWLSPNDIICRDTADYDGIHITQFSAESRYLSVDYPFINLNGSTTINGSTYIYGDMVTYNVRPGTNAGYDLGSSNYRYNRLYASYVGTNLYPIDSIFASHLSVAGNGQTYISNSYISLYASSYNNTTYYSAILLSANAAGGRISLYAGGSIYQTACYGISLSASGTYSIYLRTLSSTSGEIFIGGSWSSSAAYFSSRIGSFSTSKTHIFGRNEVTITASVGSISLLPGNGHNIHPIQTIGYQCLIGNSTMVMSKTFSTTGGNIRNQTFTNNATSNTYFTMTFRRNTLSTGYFDVAINTTWAGGIDVWYRYNVGQMLAYFNNMIAGNDYTGSTSFIKIPTTANDWQSSYMTITATPKRQTAYGTGTTMCTLIGDAPANNSTAMYFYICEDNNNGGDRNGMCARFTMPVYLTNSRY